MGIATHLGSLNVRRHQSDTHCRLGNTNASGEKAFAGRGCFFSPRGRANDTARAISSDHDCRSGARACPNSTGCSKRNRDGAGGNTSAELIALGICLTPLGRCMPLPQRVADRLRAGVASALQGRGLLARLKEVVARVSKHHTAFPSLLGLSQRSDRSFHFGIPVSVSIILQSFGDGCCNPASMRESDADEQPTRRAMSASVIAAPTRYAFRGCSFIAVASYVQRKLGVKTDLRPALTTAGYAQRKIWV